MSQPDNTTPAASAQPDGHLGELATGVAIALLLRHAAQALRLEHGAANRAITPVRVAAVALSRWAANQWVQSAGGLDKPLDAIGWARLQPELIHRLNSVRPDPAPTLPLDVGKAYRLGARQADTALGIPTRDITLPDTLPLPDLAAVVDRRYGMAERLLSTQPIQTWDQLSVALAPVHGAVADVDRDVRTVVNTAVNLAAHDAAVEYGADLLWMAERDACVVCLALAGSVVAADEDFDADATFGDKPTAWWRDDDTGPLRPPRHPRCRCRCEPWLGHSGPPGSLSLPDALKREAQRSVLRGWSLPSESESVRVRAADRLLKRGSSLPKSVRAYARRAVEKGRFPTRTVPTGKETA